MEIRLKRSEFLTELAPMQGIVERRTTIPVLSHLLLTVRGDRLYLAATDLDVSLTSWVGGEVAREGAIAVQAKKFLEIVRAAATEVQLVRRRSGRSDLLRHRPLPDPRAAGDRLSDARDRHAADRVEIPYRVSGVSSPRSSLRFRARRRASSSPGRSSIRTGRSRWWPPTAIASPSSRAVSGAKGEDSVLVPRKARRAAPVRAKSSSSSGAGTSPAFVSGRRGLCRILEPSPTTSG